LAHKKAALTGTFVDKGGGKVFAGIYSAASVIVAVLGVLLLFLSLRGLFLTPFAPRD
jgi:hypothetical protein